MNTPTPEGYKADTKGRLVPLSAIKPIDQARDELVTEIVLKAQQLHQQMASTKADLISDIDAFVDLSAERYGAKLGGTKGNISLVSFDGQYKVQLAVQETLAFDEGLQAAKALIDECVHEWTQGSRNEIKTLINDAFQVDKEGNISAGRVLGLRRYNFDDEKWQRAMTALAESVRVQNSTRYLRVYRRVGQTNKYEAIVLDMAGV
jgi:hypothetical protein